MSLNRTSWLDQLENLNYEELFAELAAINKETQTLEFKDALDPLKIAKAAVAMANAIGGVIIVGVQDPVEGRPLQASSTASFATDERACRQLRSKILARAYPSIQVDVFGCRTETSAMLSVRVSESRVAPHEYTEERGRFLVRRGTQIDGLSLRELEDLIRRRDAAGNHNDYRLEKMFGQISNDRTSGDEFFYIRLSPQRATSRILSRRDQIKIEDQVRSLPGLERVQAETLADGVLFRVVVPGDEGQPTYERRARRCYVRSDGAVEIRIPIQSTEYISYQLYRLLGNGYALSSWVLRLLGQGPAVQGAFTYCYQNQTESHGPIMLKGDGDISLDIDFSQESFSRAFVNILLYAFRSCGVANNPEEIEPGLRSFWAAQYGNRSSFADGVW